MVEAKNKRFFLPKMLFIFMLIFGIGVYVTFVVIAVNEGRSFIAALTDIGLYSFTIVIVLFGLFGWLLYRAKEQEAENEE